MADTQSQLNYRYTPSSAQSTRQILDSSPTPSPSNSTSAFTKPTTTTAAFRPAPLTRQKSHNYADADALSRSKTAESTHGEKAAGDGRRDHDGGREEGGAAVGWRPKYGRKQSWSQQDLKRELQMSVMSDGGGGKETKGGFSEVAREKEKEKE
jgi:hypothetical protein